MRAAFRAVDLAMPRLKPGKSLTFALLPQGQDPDDLLRSAGREAVVEVIEAAKPLAAMLWSRETEGHSFDTPERRAALEARINEVTAGIADDSVRKYYREDFQGRLRQFFAPAQNSGGNFQQRGQGQGGQNWRDRPKGEWQPRFGAKRPEVGSRNTPYVIVSRQMASSPVHRGARTSVPLREALLLQAAINHPWLLHDHLEELASLEFRYAEAEKLKAALIDIAAHSQAAGTDQIKTELSGRGLTGVMERIEAAITSPSVWGARPDAAPEDVLITWQQLVALHRHWHSLTKELREAELALGQDSNEANNLRLNDVKARLEKMDGTEALIEGFGASSGRGARSL
jgi:DNA primase